MAASAVRPLPQQQALTDDVYQSTWEIPTLSSAAFSGVKGSHLLISQPVPKIVITVAKEPTWIGGTLSSLSRLLNLQDDWDSYGGSKPQYIAVIQGLKLLWQVMAAGSPAPSVVPLSDGGIQFEWHRKNQDLEISVLVNEPPTFYYQHLARNEEKEGLATEIGLLASLVEGLS